MAALVCSAAGLPAVAQAEYPERPVEFVVPWPPGDLEDVLTRMIAETFQSEYGQPTAVVNKPGGGGGPFPGAAEVAQAPADGHTVGSFVISVPIVGPQLGIPALNPNPFEPIGIFLTYPFVIVTSNDAPYGSMQELADYAKNNDVTLGHFGSVLVPTKATLALAKKMDFSFASDAAFDALDCNTLASGDVDVMNTTIQLIMPCLDDLKVLATVTEERIPLVPDAPTIAELDPELSVALWNGLFVHKDTPAEAREKIAAAARKTIESEKAKKFATETGAQIYWKDAAAAQEQVVRDTETIQKINQLAEQ
ncbi:MAG: tripartite tricarboxylate transporter substrate binding protein [Rhizobiaceae bacterium]|nr:tripartite tricarboxylate transporter substrate binding protein [Rhizobiaceae bacterium]MCV0407535.1 tripartite tricarboxylate transporter substrate binding protein [Rhizobiaceae bacterium]